MPAFSFTAERSAKPEDQLEGLVCGMALVSGDFNAADVDDAWSFVRALCCVPGVWVCHLRCGNQKLPGRRIRVPEAARAK